MHIPFCKSKCAYCAFVSVCDSALMADYVDALCKEILSAYPSRRGTALDTVYIGGGTPSCLYSGALSRIFDALRAAFDVSDSAEITVEVNPESCEKSFLTECKSCGVNRISMGLQSSDDRILKRIGRLHSFDGYLKAVELLTELNFTNISSDLILGLPDQTGSDIKRSVKAFAEACSHVSVYALSVEDGTRLQKIGYSPDDDAVADLYDLTCELLDLNGFKRYEVSNFAREGKVSAHNSKYWALLPYLGFGTAAHGYDGKRCRYRHTDNVKKYIDGADIEFEFLNDVDLYNEYVMLRLRTERGIDYCDFVSRFGFDIRKKFGKSISELEKSGAITCDNTGLKIAQDKMFVMNGIIEELMV